MTVDDVAAAVEEADRLAASLQVDEYVPSEIFQHEVLADLRAHTCDDPEHCGKRGMWQAITASREFALLIRDEQQRDQMDDRDEVPNDLYGGLMMHVFTGLVGDSEEEARSFQYALNSWMVMRIQQILSSLDEDESGDSMSKIIMHEGFLAGAMFAQSVEKLRAGSN